MEKQSLRYYKVDNFYCAVLEYNYTRGSKGNFESKVSIEFSTLEEVSERLRPLIKGVKGDVIYSNGPTESEARFRESKGRSLATPLDSESEKRFLKLLGLR